MARAARSLYRDAMLCFLRSYDSVPRHGAFGQSLSCQLLPMAIAVGEGQSLLCSTGNQQSLWCSWAAPEPAFAMANSSPRVADVVTSDMRGRGLQQPTEQSTSGEPPDDCHAHRHHHAHQEHNRFHNPRRRQKRQQYMRDTYNPNGDSDGMASAVFEGLFNPGNQGDTAPRMLPQPLMVAASGMAIPHPEKVLKAGMKGRNTRTFGHAGEDAYFVTHSRCAKHDNAGELASIDSLANTSCHAIATCWPFFEMLAFDL
jgi:hypothetical protein